MAASPGGKTNHLVARSLDQGLIMAMIQAFPESAR
jgi:16S rRNA C967 or C1407 C5-methylase (RsmB/RsmF family)